MVERLLVAPVVVLNLVTGGFHRHAFMDGGGEDGCLHLHRHPAQNHRGIVEIHFHHNTYKTQIAYLQKVLRDAKVQVFFDFLHLSD